MCQVAGPWLQVDITDVGGRWRSLMQVSYGDNWCWCKVSVRVRCQVKVTHVCVRWRLLTQVTERQRDNLIGLRTPCTQHSRRCGGRDTQLYECFLDVFVKLYLSFFPCVCMCVFQHTHQVALIPKTRFVDHLKLIRTCAIHLSIMTQANVTLT